MAEELEGIWRFLNLTEEEKDNVVTVQEQNDQQYGDYQKWLIGKLYTRRPFNKEAMLGTLMVVWRISKVAEVSVLDINLFLFKFASVKDKDRVLEGAP